MRLPSLDKVANICIIVATLVFVGSIVQRNYFPTRPSTPPAARYQQGQTIPSVAGLTDLPPGGAVLLFVNSRCVFCTQSMPFYRKVLAARDRAGVDTQIIAMTREPETTTRDYLSGHDVQVDRVVQIPNGALPLLHSTPTLVLVDQQRRIEQVWVGMLGGADEERLLGLLGSIQAKVTKGTR